MSKAKAPKIKIVDKKPPLPKTKRFTVNAFLDKYLNEDKPVIFKALEYLEEKSKE